MNCHELRNLISDIEGSTPDPEPEMDSPSDIDHEEKHERIEPFGREFLENLNPLKQ